MNFSFTLELVSALLAGMVAFAIIWHDRRSIAHLAFAAGMLFLGAESVFAALSTDAWAVGEVIYWQNWRLVAMSLLPGVWLLFSLTYARGNYREFVKKWRLTLAGACLLPVGLAIVFCRSLVTGLQQAGPDEWLLPLSTPGLILNLIFLLSAIVVLMNLERTFRAAVGTMRWRIKFMVLGLGILFAVRAYCSSQVLLFRSVNFSLQALNSGALVLACLLIARSLFRVGNFEVNVYPSHAVLHHSLTAILAGVYLVIVGVLAKIVAFLGGDASFTLKAFLVLVLLVLLTMLLLSDRVRLQTRRFVSRHFQRPLYDYRKVWRTFAEGTARRVEQNDLCAEVARLASDIFQALSVTIWLLDERKEQMRFVASTSLSSAKAGHLILERADVAAVVAALTAASGPVDIDSCKEIWASALRRLHPDEFNKGNNRVCVPLAAGGELLGLMMLGDRVSGAPFLSQEFDLLKGIGDQAAASLLNIQLSNQLTQARQLEAFQAMSAFFVHDLKNTASTLSLMLQNLPAHFHEPEFREDALRGISKTVAHLNGLISRLGILRQELTIRPADCDLNELVSRALDGQKAGTGSSESAIDAPRPPGSHDSPQGIDLERDLRPLPTIQVDAAQIENVVTNLVLNAREAVSAHGIIKVETSQRNGWAVVSVADNGCGMSSEFVQNSLFRPFRTTKKKGIGIGMFQCKMIVDAHRGRIEVESEPGKGSTFRVLLPVKREAARGSEARS
jgi:putative PEP-CTERM system histidine kinase